MTKKLTDAPEYMRTLFADVSTTLDMTVEVIYHMTGVGKYMSFKPVGC